MRITHLTSMLLLTGLITMLGLTACNKAPVHVANTITVGTIAGPETDLMRVAAKVASEKYGLTIKIVEFEDYTTPNTALADKTLDANMFQHQPYLEMFIAARGYPLVAVGRTFIYPMALYSNKYRRLSDLPEGAIIGVPSDPSNGTRALLLLEQAELITLKHGTFHITIADITENLGHLKIKELDAAQLPRALADLDAAAINTNYAIVAHLDHTQALATESSSSPYANIIVAREDNQFSPDIQHLVAAFQSEPVKQAAAQIFAGRAVPAW